jgi:hypothetical protein
MLEAYIKGLCDIINEYEQEIDKVTERFIGWCLDLNDTTLRGIAAA